MKRLKNLKRAGKLKPRLGPKNIVRKDEKFDNSKFWVEYGIDLEKRKVMLDEDVDEYSVGWIVRGIHKMLEVDEEKPIEVIINSYGGSIYDGLSLYDTLRECSCDVKTYASGKIMSMGLIIYLAGDERYSQDNATFMAHSLAADYDGKMFELEIDVKECKRLQERLVNILAARTSKQVSWWKREIKYEDKYYDKDKAKELNIVTNELDEDDT